MSKEQLQGEMQAAREESTALKDSLEDIRFQLEKAKEDQALTTKALDDIRQIHGDIDIPERGDAAEGIHQRVVSLISFLQDAKKESSAEERRQKKMQLELSELTTLKTEKETKHIRLGPEGGPTLRR